MLLASVLFSALVRSQASPLPPPIPGTSIPSPLCVAAAVLTASKCDPTASRTVFDIIYSSLGVIFLCTYVSVHHNIPDQKYSRWGVTWWKLRTVILALLAPEVLIMWAMRQRIMAGKIAEVNKREDRGWTRTHGFFIQMGGLMQRKQSEETRNGACYRVVRPDMVNENTKIPYIPEKEIKDHGKGDILAKVIVVLQTTWFVAQCIARLVRGLALTEIELIALAFAVLNAVTYGLWWDKPLNIEYPIYFDEEGQRIDGPGPEEVQSEAWYKVSALAKDYDLRNKWDVLALVGMILLVILLAVLIAILLMFDMMTKESGDDSDDDNASSVHPFYAAKLDDKDFTLAVACASTIGMVFGGIHLIGWNFPFSTPAELWLWRVCSSILTLVPLAVGVAHVSHFAKGRVSVFFCVILTLTRELFQMISIVGVIVYVISRSVILFLAFYTLRCLPSSAYDNVKWTEFIPHI
ncbi:hypothetical protein AX16_000850 [Volvariella volvacea WC 439]|nr:hypothetical protein AX16_000850 [Volvariella volvacea WC 439]